MYQRPLFPRPVCLAVGAAVAAAIALPAAAQDATELDTLTVTSNRVAISVDEALVPVEVIDRAAIERSQARDLPDLLRGRAGISLATQGGTGKLTTLFLRGSESDHVLVLVDGIRIGSPTSGLVSFQDLPLAMIDRVEIVRGPRSSLYGADTIGGVIQVFTRRETAGVAARASATLGSHDFAEGTAGVGGRRGGAWFGVDTAYTTTRGIDACRGRGPDPSIPFDFGAGCFTDEPDTDGYRNRSASLRGGVDGGDAFSFNAQALRAEGRNAYDGSFQNLSKVVQQVLGAQLRWRASDTASFTLVAGRNTDASDNFIDGVDAGYFDTDRDSATLQGDVQLARGHRLTAGLDWLRDRVDSDTFYERRERDNRAAFVQYQGQLGAQSLEASLRHDDNEQFGGHTTGGIAWGIDVGDAWRLTAGYGSAFKAPTFNELYYPFFGNPGLDPESSRSWELGVAYRGDGFNARVDAYRTRVDDLIAYDAGLFLPNNIERARLQGLELGIDTRAWGWTVDASASFADTRNETGANAGNALPRRAARSARIDLDRAFGAFRLGLTGVAEGARHDDAANLTRLGGYATFDLRGEYALARDWSLQARVANVFDRDYETVAFYNTPGREWYLTLRYAPAH
ncbi:TonB-dependent vitamin B12 receptor [Marilutibacter aestuarii]|uniref:TonB-dependent vitamin B12 receptor n=1 Tax=Marilutibacter aestuarii TaxID=1706195 RepID=A0A508AAB2_9GAMM|nr:TonB-dependent vitamin B12 receptor [Lysobacter aestuarii]TQD43965.1 TonB-dependent vitamin B12 receptor [Lysobacter aestuarii]